MFDLMHSQNKDNKDRRDYKKNQNHPESQPIIAQTWYNKMPVTSHILTLY